MALLRIILFLKYNFIKNKVLTYSEYSRAARVVRSCSADGRFVEFCGCNFLSLLLMYTARKGMNSVSSTRSIPTCFNGNGSAKLNDENNLLSSLISKFEKMPRWFYLVDRGLSSKFPGFSQDDPSMS